VGGEDGVTGVAYKFMSHNPPTATVPGRDPAGIVKDAIYPFVTEGFTTISTCAPTLKAVSRFPDRVVDHGLIVVG
jgi:hypothetical protein